MMNSEGNSLDNDKEKECDENNKRELGLNDDYKTDQNTKEGNIFILGGADNTTGR